MRMWLIASIIALIALILVVFADARRLAVTGYLILQVKPYERTVPDAPVILVAGDSTGYGTGATRGSNTVAGYIGADFPNYTIENMSVNGRTIGGLAEALPERVRYNQYKLILLQIGGNDVIQKKSVTEVETQLRAVLDTATSQSEQVVMMSSGNVGAALAFVSETGESNPEYEQVTRDMREMFMRVTVEYGATYVDLFEEPENDVYLKEPKRYLAGDGLHPSDLGYFNWYEKLKPTLLTVLQ